MAGFGKIISAARVQMVRDVGGATMRLGRMAGILPRISRMARMQVALSESVPNPCDPRHPWFHSLGLAENKLNLLEYIHLNSHLIVVLLCR